MGTILDIQVPIYFMLTFATLRISIRLLVKFYTARKQAQAIAIIQRNGLTVKKIKPGNADFDKDLEKALKVICGTDYVAVDRRGQLVGKIDSVC
ncbi:hypothetical protein [Vibrio sp. 10N.239.312.D08]|uniref:hypothetical protein n=1 Tax=Vibrio sp. 10N.239.312.D08 TaxID=3229978 RepID=UPI00355211E8